MICEMLFVVSNLNSLIERFFVCVKRHMGGGGYFNHVTAGTEIPNAGT